jgi:hypothetical protein
MIWRTVSGEERSGHSSTPRRLTGYHHSATFGVTACCQCYMASKHMHCSGNQKDEIAILPHRGRPDETHLGHVSERFCGSAKVSIGRT